MSNWNRLEPWRQGNSGCVCSPAVIFVLHHASSGFFLLLFFFIHNEIDCSCGRLQKIESQNEKNERLSPDSFFVFLLFRTQNCWMESQLWCSLDSVWNCITTFFLLPTSISTFCALPFAKERLSVPLQSEHSRGSILQQYVSWHLNTSMCQL